MVFNDTTTKLGLIQDCETRLFGDNGYGQISGNTNRLYQFTARINRAQDRFVFLAMTADGRWQFDDTNNTDYPIATTNLVSGQKDYTFALEHLEIEKVLTLASATATDYTILNPVDPEYEEGKAYLESSETGSPDTYDKRANSVFLNPTPNYNATNGLKIYFKRGPNYFVYSDTTKVPGFASIFHDYLSLHASRDYAVDRGLDVAKSLDELVQRKEKDIKTFFARRAEDERRILTGKKINYI